MLRLLILIFLFCYANAQQEVLSPLEKSGYQKLTSYEELIEYVNFIVAQSKIVKAESIATTKEGSKVIALFFSKGNFGKEKDKLKILFFAQQHGNEQSGKEGALLLVKKLISEEYQYLFDRIDLALIPQMNPDGSERNQRRNSNDIDLNRNHLILTEPEVQGLHRLFNKYYFEVTLDVHEYYPYSDSWKNFGFYKNADEQLGLVSNINISHLIRKFSKEKVLPFVQKWLNEKSYSFCEYVVGGPPDREFLRFSTTDINDGRQSFGILNTLSFILEGKNGRDMQIDNIKRRAEAQAETMLSLLNFAYQHAKEIKKLVREERKNLINSKDDVVIHSDHFKNGTKFLLPVWDVTNERDTIIEVENFNPEVRQILSIKRPKGYLVNVHDTLLINFIQNHQIKYSSKIPKRSKLIVYEILSIDSVKHEGEYVVRPIISTKTIEHKDLDGKYIFIPINQIYSNMIVQAFEPESVSGLIQYKNYRYLIENKFYPIIKVK